MECTRPINGAVCFSNFDNKKCIFPSCKCRVKWIVVVGNGRRIEEKDPEDWIESEILDPNQDEIQRRLCLAFENSGSHLLRQPVLQSNIVEIHLDSVLTDKTTTISSELFKCVNVRVLSLRRNNLGYVPAEIGRLRELRTLILTENYLTVNTIPYTLTFCKHLTTLYLDHNFLDALPGFLLDMPQLETVYRHGNHNYFKSTFMWYHSAKRDRVLPLRPHRVSARIEGTLHHPESLESYSIKALVAAKINFFTPGLLPVTLQEYVSKIYTKYRICAYCGEAFYESRGGFRVFTFKSPYLGNTCVPFEHWTCSRECGIALEEPAHKQERDQAQQSDREYQRYIQTVQEQFFLKLPKDKRSVSCVVM